MYSTEQQHEETGSHIGGYLMEALQAAGTAIVDMIDGAFNRVTGAVGAMVGISRNEVHASAPVQAPQIQPAAPAMGTGNAIPEHVQQLAMSAITINKDLAASMHGSTEHASPEQHMQLSTSYLPAPERDLGSLSLA